MSGVSKPAVLQRSQAAVHGALMIEGRPAAEVGRVDERCVKPATRGFVGDRQAVDAATDHEEVERVCGERIEVAGTHEAGFIL